MKFADTDSQNTLRQELRHWLEANVPVHPLPGYDTEEGFRRHREWEARLYEGALDMTIRMSQHVYGARGLLISCIFDEDPCNQFEPMMLTCSLKGRLPAGDCRIPLGVAKVKREGTDITLIAYFRVVLRFPLR